MMMKRLPVFTRLEETPSPRRQPSWSCDTVRTSNFTHDIWVQNLYHDVILKERGVQVDPDLRRGYVPPPQNFVSADGEKATDADTSAA